MRPVEKLQKAYGLNPGKRTYSSIDLSAATDRLPLALQTTLLKVVLKDRVPDSDTFSKA